MKPIKEAVHKIDGIIRTRINLNKDNGFYQLEITQYDEEGYYRPDKSFTLAEYSEFDNALGYYSELLACNKLIEIL